VWVGNRKISNKKNDPPVPSSAANAIKNESPVNRLVTIMAKRRTLKFILCFRSINVQWLITEKAFTKAWHLFASASFTFLCGIKI
jgi:hypothetical protein